MAVLDLPFAHITQLCLYLLSGFFRLIYRLYPPYEESSLIQALCLSLLQSATQ